MLNAQDVGSRENKEMEENEDSKKQWIEQDKEIISERLDYL